MTDILVPASLDFAHEAAALRRRAMDAFHALLVLSECAESHRSQSATRIIDALIAVTALRARCDRLCRELALLNLQQPVVDAQSVDQPKPIERPIDGDLLSYCVAVEAPSRRFTRIG